MSYRELFIMDVREVLRRVAKGHGIRQIGREAGLDRKTVGRYIDAAKEAGVTSETVITEEIVHDVARRMQSRASADPGEAWCQVASHRARIEAWLAQKRPVRLSKIHTLLKRDHALTASYHTLRRYAMRELGWHKRKSTVRVADGKPGEEAQVDFGLMATIFDPEEGRHRRLYALLVTLVLSRYMFVWPTFLQTTEAVCEGLDAAWKFFGAMAHVIIPDNMSAMVAKADPLKPTLVPAFLDYTQARDLSVDTARVRTPKDKARVENQVAYTRESCFDGETLASLQDARRHAEHWCREVAGARIHGTTREVPREVFERDERAAMLAAPTEAFDVPVWATTEVQSDHHVQIAQALYSVPTRYLGLTVRVRADRSTVRIYCGTELIKIHPRVAPGKRSTDGADYPADKADCALRSVDSLLAKARARGEYIGHFAQRLLEGPLPWTRMRQAYALIGLCNTYGDGRVEALCQSALAFDVLCVTRLSRMLKAAQVAGSPEEQKAKAVSPEAPRFARSTEHFRTQGTGPRKENL